MLATTFSIFPNLLQWLSALVIAAPVAAADAPPAPPAKETEPPKASIDTVIKVKPAEPAKQPTKETLELLDRLEKQSVATKTLHATVRYDVVQGLLGDEQRRFGKLIYEAGPPARFAIHFDSLRVGAVGRPSNRWYVFDGKWLVERLDDKKQFFKWQVVAPDADPAKSNPLALGRGPFVVPIALKKDLILQRFYPELVAPDEKKDPKNSVHLKLTPLKGQRINFTEIDMYYDKETLLPIRARTLNASETESIIELSNVKLNEKIDESMLNTAEPKEKGWEVQVTPWEGPAEEKTPAKNTP